MTRLQIEKLLEIVKGTHMTKLTIIASFKVTMFMKVAQKSSFKAAGFLSQITMMYLEIKMKSNRRRLCHLIVFMNTR